MFHFAHRLLLSGLLLTITFSGHSAPASPLPVVAQEELTDAPTQETTDTGTPEAADEQPAESAAEATEAVDGMAQKAAQQAEDFAANVDASEQAQEVSAGILEPMYRLAESLEFPAFHWLAFTLMAAGVVSFALQLVLGKLAGLTKGGFSPSEILSDGVGFCISAIGLVLTTQAAAQNSTFTQSAFAVLSATGVGAVFGFVLYIWGQRQELQAIDGRTAAAKTAKAKK